MKSLYLIFLIQFLAMDANTQDYFDLNNICTQVTNVPQRNDNTVEILTNKLCNIQFQYSQNQDIVTKAQEISQILIKYSPSEKVNNLKELNTLFTDLTQLTSLINDVDLKQLNSSVDYNEFPQKKVIFDFFSKYNDYNKRIGLLDNLQMANGYVKELEKIISMSKIGKEVLECFYKDTPESQREIKILDPKKDNNKSMGLVEEYNNGKVYKKIYFSLVIDPIYALIALVHELKHSCAIHEQRESVQLIEEYEKIDEVYQNKYKSDEHFKNTVNQFIMLEENKTKVSILIDQKAKKVQLEKMIKIKADIEDRIRILSEKDKSIIDTYKQRKKISKAKNADKLNYDQLRAIDELKAYRYGVHYFSTLAQLMPEFFCKASLFSPSAMGGQLLNYGGFNIYMSKMLRSGFFAQEMLLRYVSIGLYDSQNIFKLDEFGNIIMDSNGCAIFTDEFSKKVKKDPELKDVSLKCG
ncbi:MAG: hypothetical protein H6622_09600 [Halobacteriovoraceae bacterium]|nr:hypothetical protein [Halobacteriovoraceae bacterium]